MTPDNVSVDTKEISKAEEAQGSLAAGAQQKLMRTVLENDKDTIKNGKLVSDAINQGFSSFVPDLMFDNLVKNFSVSRNLYGDKLLRLITGYNGNYLKKNIQIPEFQRELRETIQKKIDGLKEKDILTTAGTVSEKGISLASLVMYTEELDSLIPKGIEGEKENKDISIYGEKTGSRNFKKGDRFKDIDIRKTLRLAIRRGRLRIGAYDLKARDRVSKGSIYIVYAIDASGSMKGKKIESAKKAGIALAFKAIERKDKVGLLVFGTDIEAKIQPSDDFMRLLREIVRTKAVKETNITKTIKESINMFPKENITKHLILITDAVPTIGKNPQKETLDAVSMARNECITVSLIGINLAKKGEQLAEKIVRIGGGRLYALKDSAEADKVILEDYYSL